MFSPKIDDVCFRILKIGSELSEVHTPAHDALQKALQKALQEAKMHNTESRVNLAENGYATTIDAGKQQASGIPSRNDGIQWGAQPLPGTLIKLKDNAVIHTDELEAVQADPKMPGLIEGRNIHVVLPEYFEQNAGKHRASVITEVIDNLIGLVHAEVFLTQQDRDIIGNYRPYELRVIYSATKEMQTWHWIEKA